MIRKQCNKGNWRISYISQQTTAPLVRFVNAVAGINHDQDETAIVYNNQYFILNGDHCDQLAACSDIDEAMAYFRANKPLWGPTTNIPEVLQ